MFRKIAWAVVGIGIALVIFGKSGVSDISLGFSLVLGAILGVIYSIILDRHKAQTNRIIWLTLSFSTLIFMFFGRDGKLVSYYAMMLFSFPISLVVDGINYLTFYDPINEFIGWFWVAAFVLGYVQWFIFLPRLTSLRKNK